MANDCCFTYTISGDPTDINYLNLIVYERESSLSLSYTIQLLFSAQYITSPIEPDQQQQSTKCNKPVETILTTTITSPLLTTKYLDCTVNNSTVFSAVFAFLIPPYTGPPTFAVIVTQPPNANSSRGNEVSCFRTSMCGSVALMKLSGIGFGVENATTIITRTVGQESVAVINSTGSSSGVYYFPTWAGAVIGVCCGVVVLAVLLLMQRQREKRRRWKQKHEFEYLDDIWPPRWQKYSITKKKQAEDEATMKIGGNDKGGEENNGDSFAASTTVLELIMEPSFPSLLSSSSPPYNYNTDPDAIISITTPTNDLFQLRNPGTIAEPPIDELYFELKSFDNLAMPSQSSETLSLIQKFQSDSVALETRASITDATSSILFENNHGESANSLVTDSTKCIYIPSPENIIKDEFAPKEQIEATKNCNETDENNEQERSSSLSQFIPEPSPMSSPRLSRTKLEPIFENSVAVHKGTSGKHSRKSKSLYKQDKQEGFLCHLGNIMNKQ